MWQSPAISVFCGCTISQQLIGKEIQHAYQTHFVSDEPVTVWKPAATPTATPWVMGKRERCGAALRAVAVFIGTGAAEPRVARCGAGGRSAGGASGAGAAAGRA